MSVVPVTIDTWNITRMLKPLQATRRQSMIQKVGGFGYTPAELLEGILTAKPKRCSDQRCI
jgi:hypothetical protein